jgi:hypothetical protein
VISVLEKVFSGDSIVPIMIKFPESAIEYVEVFIGEVSCDFVDIFFFVNGRKCLQKIGSSNLSRGNAARMTLVNGIEDSRDDSHCIFFLKLGMVGKELQTLYKNHG